MTEIKLPNILLQNGDSISFTLETTDQGTQLIMSSPSTPPDHVRIPMIKGRLYPMHNEATARRTLLLAKWDLTYGRIDNATFQRIKERIAERYPELASITSAPPSDPPSPL